MRLFSAALCSGSSLSRCTWLLAISQLKPGISQSEYRPGCNITTQIAKHHPTPKNNTEHVQSPGAGGGRVSNEAGPASSAKSFWQVIQPVGLVLIKSFDPTRRLVYFRCFGTKPHRAKVLSKKASLISGKFHGRNLMRQFLELRSHTSILPGASLPFH